MDSLFNRRNNSLSKKEMTVLTISLLLSTMSIFIAAFHLSTIATGKSDIGRDPYDDIVSYTFVLIISLILSILFVCRLCYVHNAPRFSTAIMWTSWFTVVVMIILSISVFIILRPTGVVIRDELSEKDLEKENKKYNIIDAAWVGIIIAVSMCILGTSIGFFSRYMGL